MCGDVAHLYPAGVRPLARYWWEPLAAALLVVLTALAAMEATAGRGLLTDGPGLLLIVLAALAAGACSPRILAGGAVVLGAAFMTVATQAADPGAYAVADDAVFSLVMLGCPALFGAVWAARRREARELTRLSTIRAGQVRAAVEAAGIRETNRIASAVQHDVVQTLGGIVVRAEGALGTGAIPDVPSARPALEEIERAARTALDQLRDHIGVLRTTVPVTPTGATATMPGVPADAHGAGRAARERTVRRSAGPRVLPPALGRTDLVAALTAVPICVEVAVTDVATGPAWAAVLAPAALAAPLAARRRHPLVAAIAYVLLSTAIGVALAPLDGLVTPILPTVLLAYAVGAQQEGWARRLSGLLILAAGAVALSSVDRQASEAGSLVAMLVVLAVGVAAGAATAASAARVRALDDLVRAIDSHRDEEVRLVTERQRHAVAGDLHDSVAGAATIICLQASAAQVLPDGRGPELGEAFLAIADTARTAVREVRASLDLVDTRDPIDPEEGTLDAVLAAARRAGMDVRLARPATLPEEAEEPVTRIVRECLVNASRYAPGARVVVSALLEGDHVDLSVADDGARRAVAASPGTGTGLVGLGERLASLGGSLSHGPTASGGYAVRATLPLSPARGSAETSPTPVGPSLTRAGLSNLPAGASSTRASASHTGTAP